MNPENSETEFRLLNEQQLLTPSADAEIVARSSVLDCECPKHLSGILAKVREFQLYEQDCIFRSEKDRATHEWLYESAINLDRMISATIVQLARMEEMIDGNNQILNHPNAK